MIQAPKCRRMRWSISFGLAFLLAACATTDEQLDTSPLRPAQDPLGVRDRQSESLSEVEGESRDAPLSTRFRRLGSSQDWLSAPRVTPDDVPENLPEGPFGVSFEAMALPMFIDEVFGRILGLDYQMGEVVYNADDRVTLRMTDGHDGESIYRNALQVLARFGVEARRDGELIYFAANPDASAEQVPLLLSGRAQPTVPQTHRPIFQFVPLEVLRNPQVRSWLGSMFGNTELEVLGDPERNAIILKGPPSVVRQAVSTLEVLDQPYMRGRNVLRIDPAWRNAVEMAEELEQMLSAQGYQVTLGAGTTGAMALVPVESINALFVFAASQTVLDRVELWANQLDEAQQAHDETGIFRYAVQNTSAGNIAEVVSQLLGGSSTTGDPEGRRDQRASSSAPGAKSVGLVGGGQALVIDELRNVLLFRGTAREWQQLRPLIMQMDNPTPMVLVEVTIAEITLTNQRDLGVEGLLENIDLGSFTGSVSTQGGLGLGGSGLTAIFENPGDARLVLNAFRSSERVKILSRPHLLVKSGSEASIDVGTEVPIISSQASSPDFETPQGSGILQEIQFRETGIILSVTPIVRGRGVVDLVIEQEVSEAQQTETSNINSPSIFTRRVSTELTGRDGRALLMGGLISDNRTEGTSGVAGLSRLPLVGGLFRTEGRNSNRTELVLMLTPYVLPEHSDAEAITEAFRSRLTSGHPGGLIESGAVEDR